MAKNVKRYVHSQISRSNETKIFFSTRALAQQNATATALDLTAIAQGDADNQRIGDKVRLLSLSLGINMASNASTAANAVRIIIVSTRVEGTPVLLDILEDAAVPQSMISRYTNQATTQKVLWDKTFNLTTSVTAEVKEIYLNVFLRKELGSIEFDNGATTAPKGKIFMITQGRDNTNSPAIAVEAVLKYKDM